MGSGAVAETPWGAMEGFGSTDASGTPRASRSRDAAASQAGIRAGKWGAARGLSARSQFCCGNIPASADAMESLLLLQGSCFVVAHGGGRGQPALLLRSSGNLVALVQTSPSRPQLCLEKKRCVCVSSSPGVTARPRRFEINVGSSLGLEGTGDRG